MFATLCIQKGFNNVHDQNCAENFKSIKKKTFLELTCGCKCQPAAVLIKRTCSPGMNFKLSAKLVRDPGTFRLKLLQAISVDETPG